MVASGARTKHTLAIVSRMRRIAMRRVVPANCASQSERNPGNIVLDVTPADGREKKGDRLQHN